MGLTGNTPTALLPLNGLGVRPNSAVSVEGIEADLVEEDRKIAVLVLDDATWGVFAEGWQEGFGADADHLKTADMSSDWLAGMVLTGVVDEEAPDMVREFAYGLAKRAYGFQREPVGRA